MSQLSIFFKERYLSVHLLNKEESFIVGNIPESQIYIDSLAVSPRHAKVSYQDSGYTIEQLDDKTKILINGKKMDASESVLLSNGDEITVGKHTLHFSFDEAEEGEEEAMEKTEVLFPVVHNNGWIQYLNGNNMGKTVHIDPDGTQISDKNEENIVLIASQPDGFHLSHIKGENRAMINNKKIGEKSELLEDDATIVLGTEEVLFFLN